MVTPVQITFIVDRYLCDNNYLVTRSLFRTEASSLIAKSPIREVPKSLLSMMNAYNVDGSLIVSAHPAMAPQSFNLLVPFCPTRTKRKTKQPSYFVLRVPNIHETSVPSAYQTAPFLTVALL
ncbi:hypothetical protein D8674_014812 [Pyrus ussuriensis x Pyrus communis]|uniref:LisH domain-containing protein n=1 Tax=Pyrus ussuriensis x Pyrus communis TaxID=2448454 RepID=A0A5N5GWE3_9ROSA|nr:hypothetical protein D8674_014812 [Pyrus ussuriensis x Pyrus communis]